MNMITRSEKFEIIDFHTHPFINVETSISNYKNDYPQAEEDMKATLTSLGISGMCGAPLWLGGKFDTVTDRIRAENNLALTLAERYPSFYYPGFNVNPQYLDFSLSEVERMGRAGVKLLGELVPYLHSWSRYDEVGIHPILDLCAEFGMTVSFHTMATDSIEEMVREHPNVNFVAAHPGEHSDVLAHVDRMKKYDNLYLDISGTGIFRWQMTRYIVDRVGSERVLFGSDYPVCNPGVAIGGLFAEPLTDADFENICSKNAKRLLGIQ